MEIGIVGTGFMAQTHARAYAAMDVEVVAVASRGTATSFLEAFGFDAEVYPDSETLCRSADIDVLDICTPTHTHLEEVQAAATAGIDCFLEKPIAPTLQDAQQITALVESAGIICMVGHVVRFDDGYRKARHLEIGKPGVARARRLAPFPDWGAGEWFADPERSGGVFVDLAIHDLDYLRWCWGPVERVFARHHRENHTEHGFATLRFETGAVGSVEASWAQPESRPFTTTLELAGDAGLVEHTTNDPVGYRQWTEQDAVTEPALEVTPYRRELEHFVDCVRTGATPAVTPRAATASLRLALAARLSAERGEPVTPAEVGT